MFQALDEQQVSPEEVTAQGLLDQEKRSKQSAKQEAWINWIGFSYTGDLINYLKLRIKDADTKLDLQSAQVTPESQQEIRNQLNYRKTLKEVLNFVESSPLNQKQ